MLRKIKNSELLTDANASFEVLDIHLNRRVFVIGCLGTTVIAILGAAFSWYINSGKNFSCTHLTAIAIGIFMMLGVIGLLGSWIFSEIKYSNDHKEIFYTQLNNIRPFSNSAALV